MNATCSHCSPACHQRDGDRGKCQTSQQLKLQCHFGTTNCETSHYNFAFFNGTHLLVIVVSIYRAFTTNDHEAVKSVNGGCKREKNKDLGNGCNLTSLPQRHPIGGKRDKSLFLFSNLHEIFLIIAHVIFNFSSSSLHIFLESV